MSTSLQQELENAIQLDSNDPLRHFRDEFCLPLHSDGQPQTYFCGNSLGLQPKQLQQEMDQELAAWRELGVEGHFKGRYPWMPYHEFLREPLGRLVGAKPIEVVAMNSLTVNLHLLMVSFYRPTPQRHRIVIEQQAFPSDRYAVVSQIRHHGYDPDDALVELAPEPGQRTLTTERIEDWLREHGEQVALVMLPGVQYASGEAFDLKRITAAARAAGANVGFDLAHAAGNLPLELHDSGCDFAVWCSYKYLNGGPGAVAGCFVHERHSGRHDLNRFAGWWGHDAETRFKMGPEFIPSPGADAWQLSNPPIMGLAPVRVSLQLFDEAGMPALRDKSLKLTGYLEALINTHLADTLEILTPTDPQRRGCQLSLRVRKGRDAGRRLFDWLTERGIICDWREPDVIRAAPVPLYNRYRDAWQLVQSISEAVAQQ